MDGWAIARRIELTLGNVIRASLREPRTSRVRSLTRFALAIIAAEP
jgi:hypothetical protein